MASYRRWISYILAVLVVSLIFYRTPNKTIYPFISGVTPVIKASEQDWQRFVELEQLIANTSQNGGSYRNFAVQLDKIFDETFHYNEVLWNYAVNKIQHGLSNNAIHATKPILKCYLEYKKSLQSNTETKENIISYDYIFEQRIKYFGIKHSKELYASEFALFTAQLAPNLIDTHTQATPLCQLAH
ncbi:MAG: hypothetical protein KTR17_02120 [Cellvibrionaceae bacterium]|nr:hypothetical protein [Cellvibrionaceae bacterium]